MPLKSSFSEANGLQRGLILFGLIVMGSIMFGVGIGFIAIATGNIGAVITSVTVNSPIDQVRIMKVVQMLSQAFMFVLPALGYAFLTKTNGIKWLGLKPLNSIQAIGVSVLVTLLAVPLINLLGQWSMLVEFPASLKGLEDWMLATQQQNDDAIMAFAKMPTLADVATNVLMMAILPAIGEELIFRGVIQPELSKVFKNHHAGIWVTAFLFSAIHMQFYGLFSRMILGAIFGYLFYYSGNLKTSMIAHFTNNMLALILVLIYGVEEMETSFEDPFSLGLISMSIGLFALGVFLLIKWVKKNDLPETTNE